MEETEKCKDLLWKNEKIIACVAFRKNPTPERMLVFVKKKCFGEKLEENCRSFGVLSKTDSIFCYVIAYIL